MTWWEKLQRCESQTQLFEPTRPPELQNTAYLCVYYFLCQFRVKLERRGKFGALNNVIQSTKFYNIIIVMWIFLTTSHLQYLENTEADLLNISLECLKCLQTFWCFVTSSPIYAPQVWIFLQKSMFTENHKTILLSHTIYPTTMYISSLNMTYSHIE